jgi:hypothetical protein
MVDIDSFGSKNNSAKSSRRDEIRNGSPQEGAEVIKDESVAQAAPLRGLP